MEEKNYPIDIQGVKSSFPITVVRRKLINMGENIISLAYRQYTDRREWVTWQSNLETPDDFYWGHYFDNCFDAEKDFDKRG